MTRLLPDIDPIRTTYRAHCSLCSLFKSTPLACRVIVRDRAMSIFAKERHCRDRFEMLDFLARLADRLKLSANFKNQIAAPYYVTTTSYYQWLSVDCESLCKFILFKILPKKNET